MNGASVALLSFGGEPVWLLPAVQYLAMIQMAAAAVLLGAPTDAFRIRSLAGFRAWGLLAGLGLGLAAPLCLVAELLRPDRFASLPLRFHATSPLSWGIVAINAFLGAALAYVAVLALGRERWRTRAALLACAASAGIFLYTGLEVYLADGVPLWGQVAAPVLLVGSGLAGGTGLVLGVLGLAGALDPQAERSGRTALACLALAVAGLAVAWRLTGYSGPGAAESLPLAAATAAFAVTCLLALAGSRPSLFAACLLAVAGVYAVRFGVILDGQVAAFHGPVPATGLFGHGGLAVILAPVGLWLAFLCGAGLSPLPARLAGQGGAQ